MYGKTYKLHNSPGLAPAEALFDQSSPAFDGLCNNIKIFHVAGFHSKLLKKRRLPSERERTIVAVDRSKRINTHNYKDLVK